MAINQVPRFYKSVIEDVINNVREIFLDENIDEHILQEFKLIWENKMMRSKAVENLNILKPNQIQSAQQRIGIQTMQRNNRGQPIHVMSNNQMNAVTRNIQTGSSQISIQGVVPSSVLQFQSGPNGQILAQGQNGSPVYLQAMPPSNGRIINNSQPIAVRQPQFITQNGQTYQLQQPGQAMQTISQQNQLVNNIQQSQPLDMKMVKQSQNQVVQIDGHYDSEDDTDVQSIDSDFHDTDVNNIHSSIDKQRLFEIQLNDEHLRHEIAKIPQILEIDMPQCNIVQLDGNDEDSSDSSEDSEDNDNEASDSDIEEDPLNSNDDISDEEPADIFETDNVIVCQFEKIHRNKNKWKLCLKDGIMNLNGHDFVFQKLTGDAEW